MKTKFFERVKWLKRNVKLLVLLLVVLFLLFISCSLPDGGGAQLAMALVTGVAGGKHVVDGPLTTDVTREAAPELLLNEIDRQIVKIRPMATPVDQLSRCAGSKHAGSMIVDYHNVDTKPTSAKLRTSYVAPATEDDVDSDASRVKLYTDNDNIFDATDTILVQGVSGYNADGTLSSNELVLYVTSRDEEGGIYAMPVNGKKIGDLENCMPLSCILHLLGACCNLRTCRNSSDSIAMRHPNLTVVVESLKQRAILIYGFQVLPTIFPTTCRLYITAIIISNVLGTIADSQDGKFADKLA